MVLVTPHWSLRPVECLCNRFQREGILDGVGTSPPESGGTDGSMQSESPRVHDNTKISCGP